MADYSASSNDPGPDRDNEEHDDIIDVKEERILTPPPGSPPPPPPASTQPEVKFEKIREHGCLPTLDGASLRIFSAAKITIPPHSVGHIPTGFRLTLPPGFFAIILQKPRIEDAHYGFFLDPCVIKRDWQEEIILAVSNITKKTIIVRKHAWIACMIVQCNILGDLLCRQPERKE